MTRRSVARPARTSPRRPAAAPSTLMSLWYASPPHMANIKNAIYTSAGLGYVVRTDPGGGQAIYGVTVFTLC